MTCSGRAKKIRRMLEAQHLPDEDFNTLYKATKRARYVVPAPIGSAKPQGKRHKGESLEEFKDRRKKCNKKRRERERLWRIRA